MWLQELVAPFYSNSSLLSSDLKSLSEENAFNNMMTVGSLLSDTDIYLVHRCVVVACCSAVILCLCCPALE